MEKKQSSVEWFADRIDDIVELYPEQRQKVMDAYLQAKAMHKEEIKNIFKSLLWYQGNVIEAESEEYYNENFKFE